MSKIYYRSRFSLENQVLGLILILVIRTLCNMVLTGEGKRHIDGFVVEYSFSENQCQIALATGSFRKETARQFKKTRNHSMF